MSFGERLKNIRKKRGLTQKELANLINAKHNSVSNWENDQNKPDPDTICEICGILDISIDELLSGKQPQKNSDIIFPSNVLPIPKTKKVPRLGTIACGLPILAEENIETYDSVDENLHCDFTLLCRGDSMLPKLHENDVVLICSQPDVENGQIAAVLIGEEATLKKVYKNENSLILTAENTVYPPMIYTGEQLENISIIGKVVGIIRYF